MSQFRFQHPLRVRYSEIDGQKIVFNAHYLTYFDIAITEYFRELPYDYLSMAERLGQDFHTVRTVIDYKAPILFDEIIEVGCRTARIGRSSLTFALQIVGEERLRATGEVVWVNTDQSTHSSTALPTELVDRIRELGEGS
ncbi:MAG: thioesterase family protein [Myxococcota bacterium]